MIKKSLYTKSLGRIVAREASLNPDRLHIISYNKRWKIVKAGNTRASKVFAKQSDAILYAKKFAKKHSSSIIVHSKTGEVKNELSFAS
jgi:hypothetical protein